MRLHLQAGLLALGLFAILLASGIVTGRNLEREYIHVITPELGRTKDLSAPHSEGIQRMERVKNQGLALQREAFRQPDLLPLYGSSELMKPVSDKASVFFRNYPTGFAIFPVGKAGATSLILLQKIAAAATGRHARVAISLSPSWFFNPADRHYYEGNFSAHQALATVFDPRLSFLLKRDLAHRLLEFPETLDKHATLRFAAEHLESGGKWDRCLYYATLPLGLLETSVDSAQDHFETALYILAQRRHWEPEPERQAASLDWPSLIRQAHSLADAGSGGSDAANFYPGRFPSPAAFAENLAHGREWEDLALLLRTMKELHLKPLILSMPPPGHYLAQQGIAPAVYAKYGEKLHQLAAGSHVPLEIFEDHSLDPSFLTDHHDHLSTVGWMYYNEALDEFYHHSPKHLIAHHRLKEPAPL